jgi:predicted nucleic acid-binding protein
MNMRKRIVFDTNILVSALVFPGSQGEARARALTQ